MKRTQRRQQGRNPFDLIEEATHLLRTAPAATLASYYLGAIPFVLGLLFFWADMSRSPLAPQHLASSSFGLAALFFWMKFCQAVFMRQMRAQAAGEPFSAPIFRRAVRIFLTQAIIQPSGLFVLPLASLPALPLPWVYAFYQNAAALDDGANTGTRALMKKSWRQAKLWPRQNHLVLLIAFAFGFCVFLNWITVCAALPQLFKILFGVESDFTKNPFALFNTTFFAAMCGLTYLCVDPILKAIYTLRCFYGESLESGEDLKAELKPFIHSLPKTAAAILILLLIFSATDVSAQTTHTPAPTASQSIEPPALDRAIGQTIHERKYVWRMPREKIVEPDADQGVIAKFFTKVGQMIRDRLRAVAEWLGKLLRNLFPRSRQPQSSTSSSYGWILSLQVLLYVLAAVALAALAIFLMRIWRNRSRSPALTASEPIQPIPDLADENIRADQLPEDGWTKLAHELLARGEFRLAMRAFYLASLAHLAARNLISIARFKSNRDYARELARRAHSIENLPVIFRDNISLFERIWYGTHEATLELVHQFAAGVEKLKTGG
jgi:hypothetical protein